MTGVRKQGASPGLSAAAEPGFHRSGKSRLGRPMAGKKLGRAALLVRGKRDGAAPGGKRYTDAPLELR